MSAPLPDWQRKFRDCAEMRDAAFQRIEVLEEALREIAESPAMTDVDMIPASTMRSLRAVARRALAHEEEKA